ncbi:MAG: DnaB-like helicase N-terminal domain-containing protein [Verrucomicrobiae bacterium]|nr:DnaB-like helicase N-terminal domain-containing protein [Verrucomicrobiae bacterium]
MKLHPTRQRAILGRVLCNEAAAIDWLKTASAANFPDPLERDIFKVMRQLAADGESINLVSIVERGKVAGDWRIEWDCFLAELFSFGLTISDVGPHIRAIVERENNDPFVSSQTFGERPMIELPTAGRLLSDFASDAATHLKTKPIYCQNGRAVFVKTDGAIEGVRPEVFRTWIEKFCLCVKRIQNKKQHFEIGCTLRTDDAKGALCAPQFLEKLRPLKKVNSVPLPVLRKNGVIELLKTGYDFETQTLTLPGVEYQNDLAFDEAKKTLDDLLSEFMFADDGRSRAVAVAAMVGLFSNGLLPPRSLRPCFIYSANAEGAGKSILASCCIIPVIGKTPTGCKVADEPEIQKSLLAAIKEGAQVLLLDNIKGRLNSGALEAFLSCVEFSGRNLGENSTFTGENLATCFITGNGLSITPDLRRRSLFVELHLDVERAEDKQFRQCLDDAALLAMRPRVLAALWALVRQWDGQGRPKPSRGHSAFPSWANAVGGIVEAAGYGCALETPTSLKTAVDQDANDMRALVEKMGEQLMDFAFDDLVSLAREHGLFETLVPSSDTDLKPAERSRLGRLLARYDQRLVGKRRFIIEGSGRQKRYRVVIV